MNRNNILNLLGVLFFSVLLASCNKDDLKALITESNATVIKLNTSDYVPYGVPIVLDNDDFIMFFGSDADYNKVIVYRFNKKGEIIWSTSLNEKSAYPIYHNGQLLFACANNLYAINAANGDLNWDFPLTSEGVDITKNTYKPCITSEGNIIVCRDAYLYNYMSTVPAKIFCISPTGNKVWENIYSTQDENTERYTKFSAPIATSQGLYSVLHTSNGLNYNAILIKFNSSNGDEMKSIEFSEYSGCRLHCSNTNGDIFISGNDYLNKETCFYSFSSSLQNNWSVSFGDNYVANRAVIDNNGNIYIGVIDGYLHKFSSSGTEIFSSNLERIFIGGEMLIANDGNIYKCLQNPEKINPLTGESTTIPLNSIAVSDISMLSDGTIICSGMDEMFLVPTSANGISSNAQWPSFGGNPGHTSYNN